MAKWNYKVECCGNCAFWPLSSFSRNLNTDEPLGIGGLNCDGSVSECRKRAPMAIADSGELSGNRKFPTTRRDDFCGEFELR